MDPGCDPCRGGRGGILFVQPAAVDIGDKHDRTGRFDHAAIIGRPCGVGDLGVLDLATGAVVASSGIDAPGADPGNHNQRGALVLAGGKVLVPFGGRYGDCGTYHGVLAAVPVTTSGLGSPSWYTLPSGREGGFWAPSGPVVAADGSVYLAATPPAVARTTTPTASCI